MLHHRISRRFLQLQSCLYALVTNGVNDRRDKGHPGVLDPHGEGDSDEGNRIVDSSIVDITCNPIDVRNSTGMLYIGVSLAPRFVHVRWLL
jgi:hypothetical protein